MGSELTPRPEYAAALRRLSRVEKLRAASGLYGGARKIKAARLRTLHPEWNEAEVEKEVSRIFLHAVT
jgi:hypothetical protein